MSDDINTLAERFAAVRKYMGMNQEIFAKHVGIPKSTIQKYEGAHREPGAEALASLARMGVNVNWVLTGKGEMLVESAPAAALQPKPLAFKINVDALVAAYEGAKRTAKVGQTDEQILRNAVSLYMFMLDKGMITADGLGKQDLDNAA